MIRAILLGGRSSEFTLSSFYLAKECQEKEPLQTGRKRRSSLTSRAPGGDIEWP